MIGAMQTSSVRGVFLVLAAAMLWGTTGTAQSLAPGGLSPLWIGACSAGYRRIRPLAAANR